MSQELDPLTSLINSPSVEPLEKGEPKSSATNITPELKDLLESPSSTPLSAGGPGSVAGKYENLSLQYREPIANYIDYGVPLAAGYDWDEIRARNQGVGEKLGRGLVKMGVTAAGSAIESTIGFVAGLGSMASGGTYADNAVGRTVDKTNEWFRENLPHYYTQAEMSPDRNILDTIGTANFWTDKFANGLGYSLGSIATAYLTGGTGLMSKGITLGASNILSRAAAGSKMALTGETLKNIYSASKMIQSGTKLADAATKYGRAATALNAASYLEMGVMMSLGEASVEAREKSGQFRDEATQKWQEQNPGMEMPEDVRSGIEESARALENSVLVANLAVLTPTNLFAFGKMLKKGRMATDAATYNVVKEGEKIVQSLPKTGFGKAMYRGNQIASPVYQNALNEALQEGAQFMIGDAGIDYFKNKLDTGQADLIQSLNKGLSNTFGTADGVESMVLGALTGGGMGVAGTTFGNDKRARNIKQANTDKLLQIYNSGVFKDFIGSAEAKKDMHETIIGIELANKTGNYEVAEQLRLSLVGAYALRMHNLGALDLAFEQLDDLAALPEEEFKKAAGFALDKSVKEQTNNKSQTEIVDDIKKEMTKMIKLNDKIDNILQLTESNPSPLRQLFESAEEKQNRQFNKSYNQKIKNLLLNNMIGIDTLDSRIDENFAKLQELSPILKSLDKNSLVASVKRNKIEVDAQGNIKLPSSLADTEVTTPQDIANQKVDNEYVTTLARAFEEASNLNQLDAIDFQNTFTNFLVGIKSRENAIAAFNELITSPAKRDIEIAKKDAAKKQAAVKHATDDANELIKNAQTSKELDELVNINLLSPELVQVLKKKQDELIKQEAKLEKEYQDLPLDVLEELMADIESIEEESPQRAVALTNVYTAKTKKKTSEQVEAEGGKTDEELAKEKEAKEALKKLEGTSSEQVPGTINATPYINNIELKSPDARLLTINGIEYVNNELNPLDAIQYSIETISWDVNEPTVSTDAKADIERRRQEELTTFDPMQDKTFAKLIAKETSLRSSYALTPAESLKNQLEATEKATIQRGEELGAEINAKYDAELAALEGGQQTTTQQTTTEGKEEVTVTGVKLSTPEGQEVLFDVNSHGPIALEIAEVILTAQSSEGTEDTLGKSEVEINEEIEKYLNALALKLEKLSKTFEELGNIKDVSLSVLETTNVNLKLALDNFFLVKSQITNAYHRRGLSKQDLDKDQNIIKLNKSIKELQTIKKEVEKEIRSRKQLEDKVDPEQLQAQPITEQEENDYQHRIGQLQAEIDGLNNEIIGYNNTIELGFGSPETIEAYKEEVELIKTSKDLAQRNLNTLISEYENRKSGKTGPKVPSIQRTPQPTEEQGVGGQSEIDSSLPQQEELDVNKIADEIEEQAAEYYDPDTDYEDDFEDDDIGTSDVRVNVNPIEPLYGEAEMSTETDTDTTVADIRLIKPEHEYLGDEYKAVIADSNGELITPIRNKPGTLESIVQLPIAPWLLTNNDIVPNGTQVEFEFDKNDPNFVKANYPETEKWKHIPIYVGVITATGKKIRVGLLANYNDARVLPGETRKEMYAANLAGKTVTSSIISKEAYNDEIINVKLSNGESYYYNILDYSANPTIGIAVPENGQPTYTVVSGDLDVDLTGAQVNEYDLGQVVMVVDTPNGGKKHIKLRTASMTTAGLTAVRNAIMNNDHNRVTEIVGFNKTTEKADILRGGSTDLIFQDFLGQGEDQVVIYTFYIPAAESYIRINAEQLHRLFAGDSNPKFSFVEVVKGEKGGSDFVSSDRKDQKHFVSDIEKAFLQAIANRKYNVRKESFQVTKDYTNPVNPEKVYPGGYLQYITDPNAIPDIKQNGHKSILSMDKKVNRVKSVYYNVGINFGEIKIDGKTTAVPITTAKSSSTASIAPAPIPFDNSYEVDENLTDDEFEDDDEYDTTNDLLGDDVEAQEIERLEEQIDEDEDTYEYTEDNVISPELQRAQDIGRINLVTEEDAEMTAASPKNEGLSGSIAVAEDPTIIDPLQNVLDNIQGHFAEDLEKDPITGEDKFYIVNGQRHQRITNISSDPFTGTQEQKDQSSARGTATHDLVENILLGKPYNKPSNFSAVAFLQFIEQSNKIKALLAKRGEKIIAVETKIYDSTHSFAGKFDILVKNKKGVYKLIDVKTGTPNGLIYYNKPYKDPKTGATTKAKRQTHGTQLSLYAYAINGRANDAGLKVRIEEGEVWYVPMTSDDTGKVTNIQDFKVIPFTLNRNINKLLEGSVTFEEQTKTTDPTIKANTTNSKKAATTTAKKGTIKTEPKAGEWMKGSVEDAGIKSAILKGVIDAAGVVDIKKAMGKTITEEEAQEIINKILENNC
jgi:hypothetical protein